MSEEEADQQETAAKSEEADAQALLDAANRASERVAGVHLAFMAVCAYVLVTVFGTTDLDLLLGKGVRLPVVNVEMPLKGFFALAPFIVVLVHFNLLLQLQLLSRKLFAFDAAAPPEEGLGGLRDRLHIFPCTYYLVGRPSPLVRPFLGLMVSITVVLLPLITLLVLQLWFLAYQSEAVTWWQRGAIWLDTALIAILWPLILHPKDDWRGYWRELLVAHVPRRRAWLALAMIFFGLVLYLSGVWWPIAALGFFLLLVSALAIIPLRGWQANPHGLKVSVAGLVASAILAVTAGILLKSPILILLCPLLLLPLAVLWHPRAPRGSLALLLTLLLGLLLPLVLQVDGEGLEGLVVRLQPGPDPLPTTTLFSKGFLQDYRRLDLNEQVLLKKPPKPETLALIRSGDWQAGLKEIEPLNLRGRHLQQAQMSGVILLGADLRQAQLQGANLRETQLQGADLGKAQLQGARLGDAQLQGADLGKAQLQGAYLREARLQGADLRSADLQSADLVLAQLQGANLWRAWLQGADLREARSQGADLREARLQGADLDSAHLQGADLWGVWLQGSDLQEALLQGADLRKANLYAAEGVPSKSELIDARGVVWEPFPNDTFRIFLSSLIKDQKKSQQVLERLAKASRPGAPKLELQSCLATSDTPLVCEKRYDPNNPEEFAAFKKDLHAYLAELACESPEIAQGLIKQIKAGGPESSRQGLEVILKNLLDDKDKKCPGLQGLSQEWKDRLKAMK